MPSNVKVSRRNSVTNAITMEIKATMSTVLSSIENAEPVISSMVVRNPAFDADKESLEVRSCALEPRAKNGRVTRVLSHAMRRA